MNTKSFDTFVEEQISTAQEIGIDWGRQLQEWKNYLNIFFETVEDYLSPYVCSGKITIQKADINLEEEYIGAYCVQKMAVRIGNKEILLKPIGTNLIAAKGRVDMIGPKGQVEFVLVPKELSGPKVNVRILNEGETSASADPFDAVSEWEWKIATRPPRINYIALEAASFQSALMEVVNG